MLWLILNIWIILLIVAGLAIVLGWSLRGLMAAHGVRRAMIERDVVQTELGQAHGEIDSLYAAQHMHKSSLRDAGAEIESLKAALEDRNARLDALENERRTAPTDDIQSVQKGDAAVSPSDENETRLDTIQARNVWLEERIAHLEAEVSQTAIETEPARMAMVETEKRKWRVEYLNLRVRALERALLQRLAPAPPIPVNDPAHTAPDEAIARLRWRNRYLEGRLAYYEGQEPGISETSRDDTGPVVSLVETARQDALGDAATDTNAYGQLSPQSDADALMRPLQSVDSDTADLPSESDTAQQDSRALQDTAEATETVDVHPSDAMLSELNEVYSKGDGQTDMVAPAAQEQPSGGGDDLTQIKGIGPRIAEVLNSLGIWTLGQIADWTPQNAAWVDDHLAFSGRVGREAWVAQATALAQTQNAD